jgi:hypothetical protein
MSARSEMEMGSIDLIDCQVGSRKIPYCQVGKGEQMNSEVSSYQQEELTEKEGQKSILMIGGIRVFLPNSPVEANTSVAHESIVQQESEKEAMGPNDFKVNYVCDAGTKKERQSIRDCHDEGADIRSCPRKRRGACKIRCSLHGRWSWRCWRIG